MINCSGKWIIMVYVCNPVTREAETIISWVVDQPGGCIGRAYLKHRYRTFVCVWGGWSPNYMRCWGMEVNFGRHRIHCVCVWMNAGSNSLGVSVVKGQPQVLGLIFHEFWQLSLLFCTIYVRPGGPGTFGILLSPPRLLQAPHSWFLMRVLEIQT